MCISEIVRKFSEEARNCKSRGNLIPRSYGTTEQYYWRIAVAKPVSQPLWVGSQAKLFPSLNRRPGAAPWRWGHGVYRFYGYLHFTGLISLSLSRSLGSCTRMKRICDRRIASFFSSLYRRYPRKTSRMSRFRECRLLSLHISTC